ncbi:hypothetical protein SCALIN_C07_0041 [Candidatus Scalindua japonica]|uniref:Uncharacterized protein n=1 Tax=Candidatus Scalindua japonica TaxID=1284222 RepID=A0A286TWH5_9BACT|nr:LuxR C-terminal-related transcriptional regulator [Candidatus Scalindua japonica]GAX60230.1 hypothetical protein SCALIN_C07_0041 [Candidatus Scalindua japonica]
MQNQSDDSIKATNKYLEQRVLRSSDNLLNVNRILQKELDKRKLLEQELLISKKTLGAVFNGIQDGICIIDLEYNIIKANRTMEKWYSHSLPLVKQKCHNVFYGKSEPCLDCPVIRTFNNDTYEYELITYTGPKEGINFLERHTFPLKDDKNNITGLVEYVRDITKYKKAEKTLEEQKKDLELKNNAMREVLGQIEIEKKQMEDNIIVNAENLLLPIIQKLKLKGELSKYIDLLQKNIRELTSSFGIKLTEIESKLTSREIEICDMIRNGLTSKEIAGLLNITYGTAERHRANIRNKLGIVGKNVNLSSFLKTL